MSDAPKPAGGLDTPVLNRNNVAQRIKQIAAAKRGGAFTFQAGRADRALNLAIGIAMTLTVVNVGAGMHKMANGYGKKEGF